jgi:hypothetical protein
MLPVPEVAMVFWRKPGAAAAPLDRLVKTMRLCGLASRIFMLQSLQDGGTAIEFCNPQIPSTGEIAVDVGPGLFVISNSGPLIRDLIRKRPAGDGNGFAAGTEVLNLQEPAKGRGVLVFKTKALESLLAQRDAQVEALVGAAQDPAWRATQQKQAEASVLKQVFPEVRSAADLTNETRPVFTRLVDLRLQEWGGLLTEHRARSEQVRGWLKLFPDAAGQVAFDQDSVRLVLEGLLAY